MSDFSPVTNLETTPSDKWNRNDLLLYKILNQKTSTSAAVTRIAGAITSVTLLAANTARKQAIIINDSTSVLYVKYGATASNTDFTFIVLAGGSLIIDDYTGRLDGIWSTATGSAQLTETI